MERNQDEITCHSPDKLLTGFSKGRIVVWLLIAVAIHVVFVGVTSMGYIRDRWIDPEGAKERKVAALLAEKQQKEKSAEKPAPANVVTNKPPATPAMSIGATGATERLLSERKDTPVVKRVTARSSTNELPKRPDDLGIRIEDTNIH